MTLPDTATAADDPWLCERVRATVASPSAGDDGSTLSTAGEVLRLSIAGADAGTFERVPASGPQTITLSGAGCALTLPVR